MMQLSNQLQQLAEIAWKDGLRGRSLQRSSLLYPVNEIFAKLSQSGGHVDRQALRAAAVQDIFDHLYRIADDRFKPGKKKWEAIKQFVDIWFDDVLEGTYGGSMRKLLTDEKLKTGDQVLWDPTARLAYEKVEEGEGSSYFLEATPEESFDNVGGLDDLIEEITATISLHKDHPEVQ